MDFAYRGALLFNIGDDNALRDKPGVKLLLIGAICPNGRDECTRRDVVLRDKRAYATKLLLR